MKEDVLEIYGPRRNLYNRELGQLRQADINPADKEIIAKFHNYLFSAGSSELRVSKLSSQLRQICRWLKHALYIDKSLADLDKDDMVALAAHINRCKEKSEATRADYRRCIKQFFGWFKDEDPRMTSRGPEERQKAQQLYTFIESHLKSSYQPDKADPLTIITEDDINHVVEHGAQTAKEKAFLMALHETGCRAGEFLNLKVGSLDFSNNTHGVINVPCGKTGKRTVYVRKSVKFLLQYLEVHAHKTCANSFLWLSDSLNRRNHPMRYRGGQKLINRCFDAAGVTKRHNWHWFRHSRATILAPKLTEVLLCKYMGWSIGSKQVRNYVHLCNSQLEDAFLNMHGVKKQESAEEEPISCVCGALNDPQDRYCHRCYKPLRVDTVIQDTEAVNTEIGKTVQVMIEVLKDPEKRKAFEEYKQQLNDTS